MTPEEAQGPTRAQTVALVSSVGIGQLITWGILFYALPMLLVSLASDLGFQRERPFVAFTVALLTIGLLQARAGRLADRYGTRSVLVLGCIVGAGSMLVLRSTTGALGLFAGVVLAGACMSMSLYEMAFATIVQARGANSRRLVTGVTLFGGLASAVFWPFTHWSLTAHGWRATFFTFSLLLLGTSLLYALSLPAGTRRAPSRTAGVELGRGPLLGSFRLMAAAIAAMAIITTALGAYFPLLLAKTSAAFENGLALSVVGVCQTLSRLTELTLGSRLPPERWGLASFSGLLLALTLLALGIDSPVLAIAAAALYGASAGLWSTVGPNVGLSLYGCESPGILFNALSAPGSLLRPFAPWVLAAAVETFGPRAALAGLAGIVVLGIAAYRSAVASAKRMRPESACSVLEM